MKKLALIFLALILLTACGNKTLDSGKNIDEINIIYTEKYDLAYDKIPHEKYDLSDELLTKLNDDELAYAFFNNPFMMDIKLSSNDEHLPARVKDLKIVEKLLAKEDPLEVLTTYYDNKFKDIKEENIEYKNKEEAKLLLDSIKNTKVFTEKASEETLKALKEVINQ